MSPFDSLFQAAYAVEGTVMIAQKFGELKKRLEKECKELLTRLKKEEQPEDFGSDVGDLDEEADEAEEFATRLSIGQTFRARVNEIDGLLNKMAEGKYGACEKCGKPIADETLHRVPETKYCERCAKKK